MESRPDTTKHIVDLIAVEEIPGEQGTEARAGIPYRRRAESLFKPRKNRL
jgi:hypothetical protein